MRQRIFLTGSIPSVTKMSNSPPRFEMKAIRFQPAERVTDLSCHAGRPLRKVSIIVRGRPGR